MVPSHLLSASTRHLGPDNRPAHVCPASALSALAVASLLCFFCLLPAWSAGQAPSLPEKVATLENRYFAHDYEEQELGARLDRLEKFIFGEAKSGTENERMEALLNAVPADSQPDQTESKATSTGDNQARTAEAAASQPLTSDPAPAASPPSGSHYPTVTRLENFILGQSYTTDEVRRRLERLEIRSFGHPSVLQDMTERVDRLKAHAGMQTDWPDDDFLPSSNSYAWSQPAPASTPATNTAGLFQEVGQIEHDVFGLAYLNKSLLERVRNLEKAMFPVEPPPQYMSLPERIERLRLTVGTERRLGSYPPVSQSSRFNSYGNNSGNSFGNSYANSYGNSNSYGNNYGNSSGNSNSTLGYPAMSDPPGASNSTSANSGSKTQVARAPGGRRSFLKGLGKVLAVAGQVAIDALGSMAGGGYYYGSSMPMSGFGMGSGFGLGGGFFGSPLSIGGPMF